MIFPLEALRALLGPGLTPIVRREARPSGTETRNELD